MPRPEISAAAFFRQRPEMRQKPSGGAQFILRDSSPVGRDRSFFRAYDQDEMVQQK
jgi:hypothetical protein